MTYNSNKATFKVITNKIFTRITKGAILIQIGFKVRGVNNQILGHKKKILISIKKLDLSTFNKYKILKINDFLTYFVDIYITYLLYQ